MATNGHDDIANLAPVAALIDRVVRQPIREERAMREERAARRSGYGTVDATGKPWVNELPGTPA